MTNDESIRPTPKAHDRLPWSPVKIWILGAALFLAFLSGLECFWRFQGFTPSVTDGEDLWSYQRDRVNGAGEHTVVLLGRSRIQEAFVPEVFQETAPGYEYIQLAIGAKHPIATLRDLAQHTEFAGVVLCSITSASLLPELWEQQRPYLEYYHHQWGPLKRSSRALKTFFQSRLAVLLPELLLQRALPDLMRGELEAQFLWTHADRSQTVDYRNVDLGEFAKIQLAKLSSNLRRYVSLEGYKSWPKGLQNVEDLVSRTQGRGGVVVFICCPTSGAYRALEEQCFPRSEYWDLFAESTRAVTLHFEDMPVVCDMVCAEGTHLHVQDARTFTRILTQELQKRGILD